MIKTLKNLTRFPISIIFRKNFRQSYLNCSNVSVPFFKKSVKSWWNGSWFFFLTFYGRRTVFEKSCNVHMKQFITLWCLRVSDNDQKMKTCVTTWNMTKNWSIFPELSFSHCMQKWFKLHNNVFTSSKIIDNLFFFFSWITESRKINASSFETSSWFLLIKRMVI